MAFPGREQFRAALLRYVETPGASALASLGLSPNSVTILGFGISATAAGLVGAGFLLVGGIVFLAGSILDLMDGALARMTGKVSKFGALLDSVMDRLAEAALFLGMIIFVLREDLGDGRQLFSVVVIVLALVTSQMVSYLRARGEGLGIATRTGVMTRPERVVVLSLGLVLGLRALEVVLIVVAVISLFTLLQRLFHVQRALTEQAKSGQGVDKRPDPL